MAAPDAAGALARHDVVLATVRAWALAAQPERVVVLVDSGDGVHAAMVEWRSDGTLELTDGEATWHVAGEALALATPRPLSTPRRVPPSTLRIDVEEARLEAPIGGVDALVEAVGELARVFGGRSVATADFPTAAPEVTLTVAARAGEPVILAVGDVQFELPGGPL